MAMLHIANRPVAVRRRTDSVEQLHCGHKARSATDQGRPFKKNWRTSTAQGLVLRNVSMAASSDV